MNTFVGITDQEKNKDFRIAPRGSFNTECVCVCVCLCVHFKKNSHEGFIIFKKLIYNKPDFLLQVLSFNVLVSSFNQQRKILQKSFEKTEGKTFLSPFYKVSIILIPKLDKDAIRKENYRLHSKYRDIKI